MQDNPIMQDELTMKLNEIIEDLWRLRDKLRISDTQTRADILEIIDKVKELT